MCAQKYVIKRTSSLKFIKNLGAESFGQPDLFFVRVELNQTPESDWIISFREQFPFKENEACPKRLQLDGNRIGWKTIKAKVEENVKDIDNYIEQANEKYNKLLLDRENKRKEEEELEKKKKDELDKLNAEFKDL
jgi:hypothetical protein